MKFFNVKRFLLMFVVIAGAVGILLLLKITQTSQQLISENEVRSQLEHMYDAEVAGITMTNDLYKAVITKSGAVYLVEMNALTGEINSLEQTDTFAIENDNKKAESIDTIAEDTILIVEKPIIENTTPKETNTNVEEVKPPTQIIISKKPKDTSKKPSETALVTENAADKNSVKVVKSAISKAEEKAKEEKEEKPIKEVIKNAIIDVLTPDSSKTEEIKTAPATNKEELSQTEVVKTEISKVEESTEQVAQPTVASLTIAKEDALETVLEAKPNKSSTVLISEEQAVKIAEQQYKGTVESNSFVTTNEGGYYLIVMKAALPENQSKESNKEKHSKATIQVHAISGKILSVTWE